MTTAMHDGTINTIIIINARTKSSTIYPPYTMPFRNVLHRYSSNLIGKFAALYFMCTWYNCTALRIACSVLSFAYAFDFSSTSLLFCYPPYAKHLSLSLSLEKDIYNRWPNEDTAQAIAKERNLITRTISL